MSKYKNKNKEEEYVPMFVDDIPRIVGSKFCVGCYPEKEYASYTYRGNSLCENCFEKKIK